MKSKQSSSKRSADKVIKDIRRKTRRHFSAEDKIRIVLEGLRGDDSIAELCRQEGIAQSLYYTWSKEFMEASKRRMAGDTARAATADEVKDLRREASARKETRPHGFYEVCTAVQYGHCGQTETGPLCQWIGVGKSGNSATSEGVSGAFERCADANIKTFALF